MLLNLLVLLLWIPSLLGWGAAWRTLLVSGIGEKKPADNLNLGVVMMLGFVPLAIAATLLHFFVALSGSISVVTLVLGYVLLIYERRIVLPSFSVRSVSGAVLVMTLVSLFASRPLRHFDTGLYHIQLAKWCTTYPLVRGLANLHERLAFNTLWTPLSAVVDYPHFGESASFPITCLLLFAFGWGVFIAACSFKTAAHLVADVFLAASGCFWTTWLVIADSHHAIAPSLSTDAPVYFATLLCVYFLLRYCSGGESLDLFQALAIASLAVTLKVSAAPLFLFLLFFSVPACLKSGSTFSARFRGWSPIAATTCLLFTLWMMRSVWLSGYLVFPIPSTGLTFLPWHLPVPMAEQMVETLQAWARWPGVPPEIVLSSYAWIPGWIGRLVDEDIFYPTVAYGIFGGVMIFVARRAGGWEDVLARFWPPAAMLLLSMTYWLLTAPDPRYGYGYLFALACLVFSLGLASLLAGNVKLARVVVCCTGLVPFASVTDLSHFHFRDLSPMGVGLSATRQTDQGIVIHIAQGSQRILSGPLPSTPYFRPSLLTRVDAQGRIFQFELPKAVYTPYYSSTPTLRFQKSLEPR